MLADSLEMLGHILREELSANCRQHYEEAIRLYRRIADKEGEAIAELNLGQKHNSSILYSRLKHQWL